MGGPISQNGLAWSLPATSCSLPGLKGSCSFNIPCISSPSVIKINSNIAGSLRRSSQEPGVYFVFKHPINVKVMCSLKRLIHPLPIRKPATWGVAVQQETGVIKVCARKRNAAIHHANTRSTRFCTMRMRAPVGEQSQVYKQSFRKGKPIKV